MASEHFAHLCNDDLVLLDRGYPAFWLFALIRRKKAHFCARLKVNGWKIAKRFADSGLNEQIVRLQPGSVAKQDCAERELSSNPIVIRLIRVVLDDGEIEVLVTSLLDTKTYPISMFKELYHLRWQWKNSTRY